MLEHVPEWLGHAMRDWRAGAEKLALADPALAPPERFDLSSPAFADGGRLPDRFTADGAGVSPPLVWRYPPSGTARLALLVEDADAPTPQPLVHAVVWDLPPGPGGLAEGALGDEAETGADIGRNSYRLRAWLPPDPPTGHGEHRYVFQLYALSADVTAPSKPLGRTSLVEAMHGHVLAAGVLTGTYSRSDPVDVGSIGAAAVA